MSVSASRLLPRAPVRDGRGRAWAGAPPAAAPIPPSPPASKPQAARSPAEEELVRLWHGQLLPRDAIVTRRGERLRVVYRGRRSAGAGPDFRDAIIEGPGGQLWHGDLEVHVRASGFRLHGHDRDPAYNDVVLHLVWEDDEGEDTLLACRRRVAVVALASWFQRRRQELRGLLARPDGWREPCFSALERLGPDAVGSTLDRLGDIRFRQKTEAFRRALVPRRGSEGATDQVLYAALLEALGYGGHREAFARLAGELPCHLLRAAATHRPLAEGVARVEGMLLDASASAALTLPRSRGLRPANYPSRRLAGAARLLVRARSGLASYARACLADRQARLTSEPSPAAAIRAWTVGAVGGGGPALVGRGRAIEVLVNAVLPFLAAGGAGTDESLPERAQALFRRLPAAGGYGVTTHLERALSLEGRRRLTGSARRQQGLLYLLHQYCRQGGCARVGDSVCPLS